MFGLLFVPRRSVQSRPLPAAFKQRPNYRPFHISPPRCKSTSLGNEQYSPDNDGPSTPSAGSTASGISSSRGKRQPSSSGLKHSAGSLIAQDTKKDSLSIAKSTSANPALTCKRPYVRRKPLLPRPPKLNSPKLASSGAHPKKRKKSTTEEQQESSRQKSKATERVKVAAEDRALRENIKAQEKQDARDKKAQKIQQELDEKARKLRVRDNLQRKREEKKKDRRLEIEARLAARAAEEDRKRQFALLATKKAASDEVKKRERIVRRKERIAGAAGRATSRTKVHPEGAADYLEWAHAASNRPGSKADKRRINLTSQSLANDVLERLKPSLDKHKGCDILDINPGAGIWSATLHNYLKPRKHILLEPDETLYAPLLKPLLEAPNSKYTLIPKSGIVWRHLEEVLTKKHLPFQEALNAGDPRLEEPNNTLLVVASLGFHPRRSYRGFASISQLVLHQLMESVRSHSLFQRYGLVRMLVWTGETEALKTLPKAIGHRRKSSIEAEIACEIKEVASCTSFNSSKDSLLAKSTSSGILEKMAKGGANVPPERESDIVVEIKNDKSDDKHSKRFSRAFLSKLAKLEEGYKKGDFKNDLDRQNSPMREGQEMSNSVAWTAEYSLLQLYRRQYQSGHIIASSLQKFVDEQIEIMGLQRKHFLSANQSDQERWNEEIKSRGQNLREALEEFSRPISEGFMTLTDNAQAVAMIPPLLVWDRREAEPLKVHPEEFYPEQEMTLLDLQPKPLWPILRQNYPENWETFEFIVSQLMMVSRQPLKRGLESLAPGAFEWLIAHCPLLSDPTQGGCFDPENIRVRMLTTDMLKQMIEAWMKWPFRPTRYELIARSGSTVHDPYAMEEEGNTF